MAGACAPTPQGRAVLPCWPRQMGRMVSDCGWGRPAHAAWSACAGGVTAAGFTGSGAGVTALNASHLATGTVPDARLSSNVSLLNRLLNRFTGKVRALSFGGLAAGAAPAFEGSGSAII